MSLSPTGATRNEGQPFVRDIIEKVEKHFDDALILGTLKWDKRFGRPDVADARRAFDSKIYIPKLVDWDGAPGPLPLEIRYDITQPLHMSEIEEREGEYEIKLRGMMPNSPEDKLIDDRLFTFDYKAVIDLNREVPWVDGDGRRSSQTWRIIGSPQFFKKNGRHELRVFEVMPEQ